MLNPAAAAAAALRVADAHGSGGSAVLETGVQGAMDPKINVSELFIHPISNCTTETSSQLFDFSDPVL
jgi:hypothetical protein